MFNEANGTHPPVACTVRFCPCALRCLVGTRVSHRRAMRSFVYNTTHRLRRAAAHSAGRQPAWAYVPGWGRKGLQHNREGGTVTRHAEREPQAETHTTTASHAVRQSMLHPDEDGRALALAEPKQHTYSAHDETWSTTSDCATSDCAPCIRTLLSRLRCRTSTSSHP